MKMMKLIVLVMLVSLTRSLYSEYIVNENFSKATDEQVIDDTTGTSFNDVNYIGYTNIQGSAVGEKAKFVNNDENGGNYLYIFVEPGTGTGDRAGNVLFDANGNPTNSTGTAIPVANVVMDLPTDSFVNTVSMDIASGTGYSEDVTSWWWYRVQYSTNGGANWVSVKEITSQVTADKISISEKISVAGVDKIRLLGWPNGGTTPKVISFDNIKIDNNIIEDFNNVADETSINPAGTEINGIVYNGYTNIAPVGEGTKITNTTGTEGRIHVYPETDTRGDIAWTAGEPASSVTNVVINTPADVSIARIAMDIGRNSGSGYWWYRVQVSDDNKTSWTDVITITSAISGALVSLDEAVDLSNIDAVRVSVWRNGSTDPEAMFIDNLVLSYNPQIINLVESEEPTVDVAFKGTGKQQPVYNFIVSASDSGTPYSLTKLTVSDASSTNISGDVTEFKLYSTGSSTTFLEDNATELATTLAITPDQLGNEFTLATPLKVLDGNNIFWLTASITPSASLDNSIKLEVPTITLDNGVAVASSVTNSVNTKNVIIKDGTLPRAMNFDGSYYVDFSAYGERNTDLQLKNKFTFECKFVITDMTTERTIMGCNSNGSYWGLRLSVKENGSIWYGFKTSGEGEALPANREGTSSVGSITVDTEYHIAVVYNGDVDSPDNDVILYINGSEAHRIVVADVTGVSSGNVWDKGFRYIGHDYYGGNFIGQIDEVRLWNVAKTAAEIDASKNSTLVGDETDLQLYANLDEFTANNVSAVTTTAASNFIGHAVNSTSTLSFLGDALTPAIGVEVVQEGTELSWSVEDEVGVKEYHVVNAKTGALIEVFSAGIGSYSIALEEGVAAKLVIVDDSGLKQTFLPSDGNIVKAVYELQEGWNLIAMPGENADTSAIDSAFWGWNGSAYELVDAPAVGQAVWAYVQDAVQVIISAEKVSATLSLVPGWNMVGPTENMSIPAEAHTVYGWNDTYHSIATEDGVLLQGVGYWIFAL